MLLGNISVHELIVLEDTKLDIDDKGNVSNKPLHPSFLSNLKFTFKMHSKSIGSAFQLRTDGKGWQSLRVVHKVRNRLMHPKGITDLHVTDSEIEATKKAFDWFLISYTICSNYSQRITQAKTNATPEAVAELDQKIAALEAELLSRGN